MSRGPATTPPEGAAMDGGSLAAAPATDELGSMASLLGEVARSDADGLLAPGEVVDGHYRVLRALGEGGMGVVYLARDLRLGRDVALKLGRAVTSEALARLAREAAALARLSHPNVVVVHEVGEVHGRVYLAMEHVAGGTLRAWMSAPRSWRAIVAMFAAAGDGLAAAHEAGLVHRDFKPDNVLVGEDGRPRVADFGLARAPGDASASDADADAESGPGFASMTQTGAVMGTPAYMAPEQSAGEDLDARADQFAFCAALWEALHGRRPFDGATPAEVRVAIESSEPRGGGAQVRGVPRHVLEAVRRGLARHRADRWPSMAALCQALRRDPGARRRQILVGGALIAVGAAVAVPVAMSGDADPCAGGEAQIATAWGEAQVTAIRANLATSTGGAAWALRAADNAIAGLDAWAARWAVAHRGACVAGATWSPAVRDRSAVCLARARGALDAAVGVLRAPGPVAAHAGEIVSGLPSPERCVDPQYVVSLVAPPADPATARAVLVQEQALSRVADLRLAARFAEAETALAAIATAAAPLRYRPLAARIKVERGRLWLALADPERALPELRDSYFAARAEIDGPIAAGAAGDVAFALLDLTHDEQAEDWARLALREAEAVGDPELRRTALASLSAVAADRGDSAQAIDYAEQVVGLAAADDDRASALAVRATALAVAGRNALADRDLREAIAIVVRLRGDDDPQLIELGQQLASVARALGHYDDAIAIARRALARAEAIYGDDPVRLQGALAAVITTETQAGNHREALALIDRSLAIERASAGGGDSYNIASDLNNRALALRGLDRIDEAVASWREGVAMARRALGEDHPLVATLAGNLADALVAHGRADEAIAAADVAIAIWDARDPTNPSAAWALTARGQAHAARQAWAPARADLERALSLRSAPDVAPVERAATELALAQVAKSTGDVPRARTLATSARAGFAATQDSRGAAVEALLRALPE
ncbi:MAG: serine/threonine-protein kinase [Deltaproteobacteria bacterium]|nr:serine/threonine-protein kinase [Deltaproteobacteria bacterium]